MLAWVSLVSSDQGSREASDDLERLALGGESVPNVANDPVSVTVCQRFVLKRRVPCSHRVHIDHDPGTASTSESTKSDRPRSAYRSPVLPRTSTENPSSLSTKFGRDF